MRTGRRLARDAGHLAVDELIGDQIANHEDPAAAERVDEPEQAFLALGLTGQRMHRSRDQHGEAWQG